MSAAEGPQGSGIVFERTDDLASAGHEQVVFCRDRESGLRAIIAIHDTTLGPALGGTRMYPYRSEADALRDVLRLSRGMTSKSAAAGLSLGGGKAVIIGGRELKTRQLLLAYGRFVQSLGGRYYTAADVGTTAADLDVIAGSTSYVVGTTVRGSGDSGGSTAQGVFAAMRAAAGHVFGSGGLAGRTVGIEGVGKVGSRLADLLVRAGAGQIVISDPDPEAAGRVTARHPRIRTAASVLDADVDIYAPCALGATLTPESVPRLRAAIVCGGANNQLSTDSVAQDLLSAGITWVPDYIANAGGVIQVGSELAGASPEQVRQQVERIFVTVTEVLTRAKEAGLTTLAAADAMVAERLRRAREAGRAPAGS
jgi:valine dehydrogenase (NAD+)